MYVKFPNKRDFWHAKINYRRKRRAATTASNRESLPNIKSQTVDSIDTERASQKERHITLNDDLNVEVEYVDTKS